MKPPVGSPSLERDNQKGRSMLFARGRALRALVVAIVLAVSVPPALAAGDKSAFLRGGTCDAGNDFYQVHVQDLPRLNGVGLYTITTGPAHPAGSGLNVLYGNSEPGTTFNTIRSYTSGTDYVQASIGGV